MFLRTGAKVMSTSLIDKLNRFYYHFIISSFTQTFTEVVSLSHRACRSVTSLQEIGFDKLNLTYKDFIAMGHEVATVVSLIAIVHPLLFFFACPKKKQKKTTGNEYSPFPV
jgi:hypothetical protein